MNDAQFLDILAYLKRGKYKFDKKKMSAFLEHAQSCDVQSLLFVLFPEKKTKVRKRRVDQPEWIKVMQKSSKRLSWSARDAVDKLYELARANGYDSKFAQKKSIPAASKQIAMVLGEQNTLEIFVDWIEKYESSHTMI